MGAKAVKELRPTSPIGSVNAAARSSGFLLLDMAMALTVLLLLSAIIWPVFGSGTTSMQQSATALDIATLLRMDRTSASRTGISTGTRIDLDRRTVTGANGKATQVGGMTASSLATIGNIGVQGVKVLTGLSPAPSPPILGGAEFDFPVSGTSLQSEGCPDGNSDCTGLTPEEAAYNVMTVFFTGTPAAAFYGGTVGAAAMQYLEISYLDLQYALATPCPAAPSSNIGHMSLQDLYSRASHDLFAMANQPTSLPASRPTSSAESVRPSVSTTAIASASSPAGGVQPSNRWLLVTMSPRVSRMTPEAVASSRSPLTSKRTTDGPMAWATAAKAWESA